MSHTYTLPSPAVGGEGRGGIRWEGGEVGYGGKGASWDMVGRERGGIRWEEGEVGPTTNQIKNYLLQVCNNACHTTESKV